MTSRRGAIREMEGMDGDPLPLFAAADVLDRADLWSDAMESPLRPAPLVGSLPGTYFSTTWFGLSELTPWSVTVVPSLSDTIVLPPEDMVGSVVMP